MAMSFFVITEEEKTCSILLCLREVVYHLRSRLKRCQQVLLFLKLNFSATLAALTSRKVFFCTYNVAIESIYSTWFSLRIRNTYAMIVFPHLAIEQSVKIQLT